MPRIIVNRPAAACALALLLSLLVAAGASAKGFGAELRVVGKGDKVLAEKTLRTGTASVKTSPRATCFGAGTGGSGKSVALKANTAMGLLAKGSKSTGSLRPLLISDHFDFGLALCRIGHSVAEGSASWYLKINHKSLKVGGELAKIRPGDEVLWALAETEAPDYTYPEELALVAPQQVKKGRKFNARVFAYDEKGQRHPVEDAEVNGAEGLTDAQGRVKVTLRGPRRLIARADGYIPSARDAVCVGGSCPGGRRR